MKTIICGILLTLLMMCGNVYSNSAMDALRSEMDALRPLAEQSMENLERFAKFREILQSMERQEKDNETIRQWDEYQSGLEEEPCENMYRKECENGVMI